MRHGQKQESIIHTQDEKLPIDIVPEEAQTLHLLVKDF